MNAENQRCLLIGNGINRCCGGMSWEQLLSKIAGNYFVSPDTVKSSVLAFEQLKCTVLSKNIRLSSDSFAIEILQELDKIEQDLYRAIFTEFLSLPINNILTTNFDYSIERTIVKGYTYRENTKNVVRPQETKCSRIRHSNLNNKKVFHIHGELGKMGTICLGNVHYAENLGSIMNALLDYDKETDSYNLKDGIFQQGLVSWAQFFFTSDIYIVGLGLYDCDMDLWWLIAYRKQLMLYNDERIKNKIIYYYLYTNIKNQNFKDCLESMGIEVRELKIDNGDWSQAYVRVAHDIKSLI